MLFLCRSCNDCRQDLECGFCYVDLGDAVINSSCLPTIYDNPWASTVGRCNGSTLQNGLTWAYDYCPTPYFWMPMVGLVLYLVFFAPGAWPAGCFGVVRGAVCLTPDNRFLLKIYSKIDKGVGRVGVGGRRTCYPY